MTPDPLQSILRTPPGSEQLREPARRASIGALARVRARRMDARWPAFVLAGAALAFVGWFLVAPVPRLVSDPAPGRLAVDFTLSDGTKVVWTFDDRFNLE
ncbi:MAG TPA: hypothetical protein VFB63_09010 [Bryobacteraceae bacterium]|jgi:hypothetical protein|nr:hypothetical protein [Bryobacteraceae bacterium]